MHLLFLCDVYVHTVLVLELCVFCFCLLLLLSPGSVWLQFLPACMLFSQLAKSLYLCLFYNVSPAENGCGRHAPRTFILVDYSDGKCAGFFLVLICKLCSSFHGFVSVFNAPWWFWVLFSHFLWHFKSFLVQLWHGCPQASVENIMKEKMPKKGGRWWFSWRSKNSDIKSVCWLTPRHSQPYLFIHYIEGLAKAGILQEWMTFDLCCPPGVRGRRSSRGEHSLSAPR